MEKPHTWLDECPRNLLSCFRARNSGREWGRTLERKKERPWILSALTEGAMKSLPSLPRRRCCQNSLKRVAVRISAVSFFFFGLQYYTLLYWVGRRLVPSFRNMFSESSPCFLGQPGNSQKTFYKTFGTSGRPITWCIHCGFQRLDCTRLVRHVRMLHGALRNDKERRGVEWFLNVAPAWVR